MESAIRLKDISREIREATQICGRDPRDVELMLVTKTVAAPRIAQTLQFGHRLYGENKVQEVVQKWGSPELRSIKPDFIGHLQTNKVKTCLDVCGRIHSVDRLRLVEALDHELKSRGETREIFLQVNTSEEESKFGVSLKEALSFAKSVQGYKTLKVTGLMTLALFSQDEALVRPCFQRLKWLFDDIQKEDLFGNEFRHLSMGMSGDYKVAIQEGATIVRVGTAIFGARSTPDSEYWPETKK